MKIIELREPCAAMAVGPNGERAPLSAESGFYTGIAKNTRGRRYHFWAKPDELIERCFLEDSEEPQYLWSLRAPKALSVTVRDAILNVARMRSSDAAGLPINS